MSLVIISALDNKFDISFKNRPLLQARLSISMTDYGGYHVHISTPTGITIQAKQRTSTQNIAALGLHARSNFCGNPLIDSALASFYIYSESANVPKSTMSILSILLHLHHQLRLADHKLLKTLPMLWD